MAALGEDPSCCVDEAKKNPSGTTLERFMVQKGPVLDKEVLDRLIAEFVATDEQPIAKKKGGANNHSISRPRKSTSKMYS